jgi:hypothetical protein
VIDHKLPPSPQQFANQQEYEESFLQIFRHCIDIQYSQVPLKDYDFWVVAFKGADGKDVFRKDADKNEIAGFWRDPDGYCKVWRQFHCPSGKPLGWVVWPHSESKGWCDQITGKLG